MRYVYVFVASVAFILVLLLSAEANCQERFWTPERKAEVPAFLIATGFDAYVTHQVLIPYWHRIPDCRQRIDHPHDCSFLVQGRERDPFTRQFVTHGTTAQVAYFSGLSAAVVGGSYLLEKHHHHKMANLLLRVQLASETQAALYTGLQ